MIHARATKITAVLAMLAAVVPTPGLAGTASSGEQAIRESDNGITLELGDTNFNYRESSGGVTQDSDSAWLPTATLGWGLLANDNARGPLRDLYLHADLTGSIGSAQYNGLGCTINSCNATLTTSDESIVNLAMRAGRAIPIGGNALLTPFVEIDYRYWDRAVNGFAPVNEIFTNWAGLGGAMVQMAPFDRTVLTFSSAAGTTYDAQMNTAGLSAFSLGSELIWRSQARIAYQLSDRTSLVGDLGYDTFGFGSSSTQFSAAGTCAGGCFVPASTTEQISVAGGIAYRF